MFTNLTLKKKIIFIVIAVIVVAGITIGTIFLVKSITNNNNSSNNKTTTTKDTVDSLKVQAIEAEKTNDSTKAKELFQQAKQQYEELGDTNGVVDMNAKIYLIEHSANPAP